MTTEEIKKAADELVKEHHKIVEKTNPFTVFTATFHAIITVKKKIEVLEEIIFMYGGQIRSEGWCFTANRKLNKKKAILKELENRVK